MLKQQLPVKVERDSVRIILLKLEKQKKYAIQLFCNAKKG